MSDEKKIRRRPGERADITYDQVVSAAVTIYRGGGVKAVSMRSVAAILGVAPNALYSHVSDKHGLLAGLIDSLLGEVEVSDAGKRWQDGVFELMVASRSVLLKYGDLMPLFLAHPTRGPNAVRLGETSLEYLARAGLTGQNAVDALQVLLVYTVGFSAQEYPRSIDPDGPKRTHAAQTVFDRSDDRPLTKSAAAMLAEHPGSNAFNLGLRWLIEGIAAAAPKT